MAKHHILIMDDTIHEHLGWGMHISTDHIFGNNPDVDCQVAQNPDEARHILNLWKAKGASPDIIVGDYLYGNYNGIEVLAELVERMETKPYKLFVTSKSGLNSYNSKQDERARKLAQALGIEYCHTSEIESIAAYCNGRRNPHELSVATDSLRKCVNERFGLDIPDQLGELVLDKMEAERLEQERKASGPLSLTDIGADLSQRPEHRELKGTPPELLMRLDIDGLREESRPRIEGHHNTIEGIADPERDLRFKEMTGGVVSGYAAFNAEQVAALKKQGKKAVLLLQDFKPNQFALLKNIDGIMLLGNGPSHLAPLCKSLRIPGVFKPTLYQHENDPYARIENGEMKMGIPAGFRGGTYDEDGNYNRDQTKKARENVVRFGDPVTIGVERQYEPSELDHDKYEERYYGRMYPKALDIKQASREINYYYKNMRTLADGIRLMGWHKPDKRSCNGMHVKAIAETPESIAQAVKYDAGGVGLLRTEHMFIEESRQQALYTALLSDDDQKRASALQMMRAAQQKDFSELFDTLKQAQADHCKEMQADHYNTAMHHLSEEDKLADLLYAIQDNLSGESLEAFNDLHYAKRSKIDDWHRKQHSSTEAAVMSSLTFEEPQKIIGFLQQAVPNMSAEQKQEFKMLISSLDMPKPQPFPITARLLDAKLTELLPDPSSTDPEDRAHMTALAQKLGMDESKMREKIATLRAEDARGAQFSTAMSDLYSVQVDAMLGAAHDANYHDLEIMVPFVKTGKDVARVREMMKPLAEKHNMQDHVKLGSMIETRESVMNAKDIARASDFLSFGTNDLSCEILDLPRNDIVAEEEWRTQKGKLEITEGKYPSRSLVPEVRSAMQMVVNAARSVKPTIKIGICGDQVAEDEASQQFCQSLYLHSISVPTDTHILVPALFSAAKVAAKQRVLDHPTPKASFTLREDARAEEAQDQARDGTRRI